MIRIGVCDDSRDFLEQINLLLRNLDNRSHNIRTDLFEDGDALIEAHRKNPFDIILLDIMMPLLNGIDTAKELRGKDKNVKIVFLTSSPEFAVDSYTVKASNYLLKPIDSAAFFCCLDELIAEVESFSKCITVKGLDATHRILVSDIEYIESQSKHIVFYIGGGKTVESTDPLYVYEGNLLLEDGFFKCHRSYIVNVRHIDSYSHSQLVMRSGCRIPISRSNQKSFEDMYFQIVFERAGDEF